MDPGVSRDLIRKEGARAVQLPVTEHYAVSLQHPRLHELDRLTGIPGQLPGDALDQEPATPRLRRRGQQIDRALTADPGIGFGMLPEQ